MKACPFKLKVIAASVRCNILGSVKCEQRSGLCHTATISRALENGTTKEGDPFEALRAKGHTRY